MASYLEKCYYCNTEQGVFLDAKRTINGKSMDIVSCLECLKEKDSKYYKEMKEKYAK